MAMERVALSRLRVLIGLSRSVTQIMATCLIKWLLGYKSTDIILFPQLCISEIFFLDSGDFVLLCRPVDDFISVV